MATPPESSYNKSYPLSQVEWEIVKTVRSILQNEYGNIVIKIDSGRITDVLPTPAVSRKKLREMQP